MTIKFIYRIGFALLCLLMTLGLNAQVRPSQEDWCDVDFKDTTLVSSEAFSTRMVKALYLNTAADDMVQFDSLSIMSIATLLDKSKVNMRVYEYVLEFMLKGFSNMGRTQVVDYLLNYPMLHEGDITEAEGLRLDSITEPFQLVKAGAQAPEISGMTVDGYAYDLYRTQAEWVIIVFWSTDCEYCHDFLVQIRRNLNLKSDFELVTYALAENQEEVAASVKKMRLPGYHFYDAMRWESKAFLGYHVTATPTVFVVDKNKTIVCKPYDWDELKYWLKSNNISY